MKRISMIALLGLLTTMATAQERKFVLDGKIESDTTFDGMIYIKYTDAGNEITDSVLLKNNTYHFEKPITDGAVKAYLYRYDLGKRNPDNTSENLLGFAVVQLDANAITAVHKSDLLRPVVTGSKAHEEHDYIIKALDSGIYNQVDFFTDFVLQHPNSWQNITIIYHLLPNPYVSPEKLDSLYNNFGAELKSYDATRAVGEIIAARKKTAIGQPSPDFTLNDTNGKPVSLSSFRGKYVLVDFWASWCGPCREENPNILKAYQLFKSNGFEVLGVSLDDEEAEKFWRQAIKKDNLPWTQVSDLKGWKSEAGIKYGVQSIPASFLISPEGIIIAKNLRGEALSEKLREIFKK